MRTYASFFESESKPIKELGVVVELITALNTSVNIGFHSPHISDIDPPDCFCFNSENKLVGLEVAEVVCEDAARLNAQGQDV